MKKEISVNERLQLVQSAAKAAGVNLTLTNMKIYFKLLDFAKEAGDRALVDASGIRFEATTQELTKYCSCSPRMITDTLRKLRDCGVIKYMINTPKPSIITIFDKYR